MSNHQKRLSVPKSWPVERKEATFTVKAGAGPHGESGVPLLILLRDVLNYVDSKKEAKYALNHGSVLVNGSSRRDPNRPIGMFDILAFTERDEYYRVFPDEGGRLALTPIDESDADGRLGKIVRKQQVSGGDTQITLHDGSNLVVDADSGYSTGDSLVVDLDGNSVVAHFPYEEGALVTAIDGRHAGEIGTVEEILVTPGSGNNSVTVSQEDSETPSESRAAGEAGDDGGFETIEDYVVVIDENFTSDETESAQELAEEGEFGEDESEAETADADEGTDQGADDE